jgi:small subunit ribosomal protein S7
MADDNTQPPSPEPATEKKEEKAPEAPAAPVAPPAPAPVEAKPEGSKPAERQSAPAAPPVLPVATDAPAEAAPEAPPVPVRKFDLPLLFGRYSFDGITVKDPGLKRYINIQPIAIPHTNAKYANKPFSKQKVNIVERLINGMMRTEHATGEKARTYRMVQQAFRIIEDKTKQNPIQVLVDAVEKASIREEVTRLKYGGISVPKAVDCSSYRRVNIAVKNITQGVIKASRGNKKRIEQCLADELMMAARADVNSYAMGKKGEIERVASSAR